MPGARVSFEQMDANEKLPFADGSFDAVFSNDAMCHIPDRKCTLKEWCRVLRPDGRILFTDAMIVTGPITNEQLLTRSSIGLYVFLPPGENERLIREAEFELITSVDLTANMAAISKRWHDARGRRSDDLVLIEGISTFQSLQSFLSCVHTCVREAPAVSIYVRGTSTDINGRPALSRARPWTLALAHVSTFSDA